MRVTQEDLPMSQQHCPTRDELTSYVRGLLPLSDADTVSIHVAACRECEETVSSLSSISEGFVERLRSAAGTEPYVDEPACRKVVQSLQKTGLQEAGPVAAESRKSEATLPAGLPAGASASYSPSEPVRPMNRTQFTEFVTTTGHVSPKELTAVETQLGSAEGAAADAQTLARLLVERGKLTKYQAAAVYQGKGKSLVFGDYVVIDRIGAGGMGQVFKARHRRMDRIVALKVMSAVSMKNPDAVKRFEREVRAAAKVMHPNIVTALDAGSQDGVHYLVMEYVDGPDLSSLVKKQGKLSVKQACDYIAQGARGFAFAHSKGIVHRDIKPGNLLVDRDGTVKVLDLGLARFDHLAPGDAAEGELTQSGAVMGTLDYMAPEQALNTSQADSKSDVYGLGCTLYRMLTGEAVYGGQSMVEKILAHREQPVPSLRLTRPDAPPSLDAFVARMLAKRPADRPTMQEIADGLSAIGTGGPLPAGALPQGMASGASTIPQAVSMAAPPTAPSFGPSYLPSAGAPAVSMSRTKSGVPPRRRSNVGLVAAAGAGAVAVALGVWIYITSKEGQPPVAIHVPDGSKIEIVPEGTPTGTAPIPSGTAPSGLPIGSRPFEFFTLPPQATNSPTGTPAAPAGGFEGTVLAGADPAVERRAIEKLLELGGVGSIMTVAKPSSSQMRQAIQLPPEPFVVHTLDWNRTGVSNADFAVVRGLKRVLILRLPQVNVTDVGLESLRDLTTLTELRLNGNRITDGGLKQLEGLSRLTILDLKDTYVTAAGASVLQAKLPNCKIEVLTRPATPPAVAGLTPNAVTPAGGSPSAPLDPAAERAIAELVLSKSSGAHLHVFDTAKKKIPAGTALPNGPFRVVEIYLRGGVDDEVVRQIARLTWLQKLEL
jgi:eukaryotic-like serine/threonine-protein kinase